MYLASEFHSLVGRKHGKQFPNTQTNDPCAPKHTVRVEAQRDGERKSGKKKATGGRCLDHISETIRSAAPRGNWCLKLADTHSKLPFKLFELAFSFLGTCVLVYRSGLCGKRRFGSKQSVACPHVALADLARRIKCLTLDSYIHLVSSSDLFWQTYKGVLYAMLRWLRFNLIFKIKLFRGILITVGFF